MDFNVDVNVKTIGSERIDALEKQINSLKNESIKINVDIDSSKIQKALDKSYKIKVDTGNIGKEISTAIKSDKKSSPKVKVGIDKSSIEDFVEAKKGLKEDVKEVKKKIHDVSKGEFSKKEEVQYAKEYVKDQINIAKKAAKEDARVQEKANQETIRSFNSLVKNASGQYAELSTWQSLQQKVLSENDNVTSNILEKKISERVASIQQILDKVESFKNSIDKDTYDQGVSDIVNARKDATINKQLAEINIAKKAAKEDARVQEKAVKTKQNFLNGDYDVKLAKMKNKLGLYEGQSSPSLVAAQKALDTFQSRYDKISRSVQGNKITLNGNEFQSEINGMNSALQKFNNQMAITALESTKSISSIKALTSSNSMLNWLENNSKAMKKYGEQIKLIAERQRNAKTIGELNANNADFNRVKSQAVLEGLTGRSFTEQFKNLYSKFSSWFGVSQVAMTGYYKVKEALGELKEVDSIITEISKTSDLTSAQLKELGHTSFDKASTYGKKASDYLVGIQEMYRAGYQNAQQLAELSTLAQSAGDLDKDLANDYLIASDAAYGYAGDVEKLTALLDSQNQVTNRNAVSMEELANATKIAANQLSNSNIKENEMTALLGTGIATTREAGETVGRAVKGIIMNLQQVEGETGFDGEIIDAEALAKVESRCHGVGVELEYVENGVARLRNPITVLKELSEVYNSLPKDSAERAGIISDIGGKYRGNVLSSILSNWDKYEKMLADYEDAEGSAYSEAMKSANNWEGSLNRLSNTWTETIGNFADSNTIIATVNSLNSLLSVVGDVTNGISQLNNLGGRTSGISSWIGMITGLILSKTGHGERTSSSGDVYCAHPLKIA